MINRNVADKYRQSAVATASPAELTLMLYEGAIKFANIALAALEKDDYREYDKVNTNIKKTRAIITEFRSTLDRKYPVWEDFERVYEYIDWCLSQANINKDPKMLEEALKRIREMRDTWKEVMKINNVGYH